MLSEDDKVDLFNAAMQMIDSTLDEDLVFKEACSLSKKLKLEAGVAGPQITVDSLLSIFKNGFGSRILFPTPKLAKVIIDLSRESPPGSDQLLDHLLEEKFKNCLGLLASQSKDSSFDVSLFASMVLRHEIPLEIIWNLHKFEILTLQTYITSKFTSSTLLSEFSKDLVSLCLGTKETLQRRQQILSGFISFFVNKSFGDVKLSYKGINKESFMQVLNDVIIATLELSEAVDDKGSLALPSLWTQENTTEETLRKFSTHALLHILSYKRDTSFPEILTSKTDWRTVPTFGVLRTLFTQLLTPLNCKEVTDILIRSLDNQEVNGISTLIFMSVMYISFPDAAGFIKDFISETLVAGLESGDDMIMSKAFLIARQSAAVGQHTFGSYEHWFESLLSGSNNPLTASRRVFTSLIKFMSGLVPYESADYLKAHIIKKPALTTKTREIYEDYISLAKTRLKDLGVSLFDVFEGIYDALTNKPTTSEKLKTADPTDTDVEKAVASFTDTGKIPTALNEASIFRKPYFIGKFLPALLKPRFLPDVPDMKMKLIEDLNKSGRIPQSLYNRYKEDCEKEKQALLEGVFDVDDDGDDIDSMTMSPNEEFCLQLSKYQEAVNNDQSNKMSDILNTIVNTLSGLLQPSRQQTKEDVHKICSVHIDLTKPPKQSDVEVVQSLLDHMTKLLPSGCSQIPNTKTLRGMKKLFSVLSQLPHFWLLLLHHTIANFEVQAYNATPQLSARAWAFLNTAINRQITEVIITRRVCKPAARTSTYVNIFDAVIDSLAHHSCLEYSEVWRFWLVYTSLALSCLDAEAKQLEDDGLCLVDPTKADDCILPGIIIKQFILLHQRFGNSEACLSLSSYGGDELLVEEKETSLRTGIGTLMSSQRWENLSKNNQPTLKDWIEFEMTIDSFRDDTSRNKRATAMWKMSCQYLRTSQDSGSALKCYSDFVYILAKHGMECSRAKQKRCPESSASLLNLLKKHILQLPRSDQGRNLWLTSTLGLPGALAHMDLLLRTIIELPAHLVFCNSPQEKITRTHIESALAIVRYFANSNLNKGGYLCLEATVYIIQSYNSVKQNSTSQTELDMFMTHPLISVSILVHKKTLEGTMNLLNELEPQRLSQLTDALQWAESFLKTECDSTTKEPVSDWQKGAALFTVLRKRKNLPSWQLEDKFVKKETNLFMYFLQIATFYLSLNDKKESTALTCMVSQLLSANGSLLTYLLDPSHPSMTSFGSSLGIENHSRLRDLCILSLTASVPATSLLQSAGGDLLLAVFTAYNRLVSLALEEGMINFDSDQSEARMTAVTEWLKQLVDITSIEVLKQINLSLLDQPGVHVVLFKYIADQARRR